MDNVRPDWEAMHMNILAGEEKMSEVRTAMGYE